MGIEEEKGGAFDFEGYFAKQKLQEIEQKKVNDQMKKMGEKIDTMGQNIEKVVLGMDGMGEGKKTVLDFNIQQCWERIKASQHGWEDMDNIFSDRFAKNPEFRKMALDKLSTEDFVSDVKGKQIEDKLLGMCKDESCRVDVEQKIKEAKKGKQKTLL